MADSRDCARALHGLFDERRGPRPTYRRSLNPHRRDLVSTWRDWVRIHGDEESALGAIVVAIEEGAA